jgi:spoIIIJ-associated protein
LERKQDDYLRSLASQAIERLKETGEEQCLYNLTPSQRRIVHLVVAETEGIASESRGEGEERYLVIKKDEPKTKQ